LIKAYGKQACHGPSWPSFILSGVASTSRQLRRRLYENCWKKKPLHVASDDETWLDGFLSKDSICELLETHPVYNGRDLNVTRYEERKDGIKRRITLDPQADNDEEFFLADSKDVLENFDSGCTLRLLCPHKHNDALRALLSTLEWEWGCMVGANVYLTQAAASQGFASHYDDIEAFVLQLEGYKHWKVYAPLSKMERIDSKRSRSCVKNSARRPRNAS
jgi:lysine-specific demethylase/histidyl-hydroxylase NO66